MASVNYKDFYIKKSNDPLFNDSVIETNTKLELIISKIYMILLTNKGEVLGDENFGGDIPKYLWKTRFPASTIQNNLNEQFQIYIPELTKNDYKINVYIIPGTHQDIGIIEVDLYLTSVTLLFK
jgi:hypothetical protein